MSADPGILFNCPGKLSEFQVERKKQGAIRRDSEVSLSKQLNPKKASLRKITHLSGWNAFFVRHVCMLHASSLQGSLMAGIQGSPSKN
jgi:hypothetical protein